MQIIVDVEPYEIDSIKRNIEQSIYDQIKRELNIRQLVMVTKTLLDLLTNIGYNIISIIV